MKVVPRSICSRLSVEKGGGFFASVPVFLKGVVFVTSSHAVPVPFLLRPWQVEDIPSVAKYADNPCIAAWLRNVFPHPYTRQDAESYIYSCIEAGEDGQITRAIVADGTAVGSIGIFRNQDIYERTAEIGYWLAEPYWGHSILSRAVPQLCAEAFARWEDLVRIYAEPFADNPGSRRVLEKSGFTLEGILRNHICKNGTLHDSCIYALLREETLPSLQQA